MTVGLDLGDKTTALCLMDEPGEVIEEANIKTSEPALRRRFQGQPRMRIALEVGTHSPWVSRVLRDCGHEVLVANARKLRMIYHNDRKDDRADAEMLARVARLDPQLLSPIEHRSAQAQADLTLVKNRHALVEARTNLINHVRGVLKSLGSRLEDCSSASFHKQADKIPEALRRGLEPLMVLIGEISVGIKFLDQELEKVAEQRYPETTLLQVIPGVGPVTALTFILTLEEPERFSKSRKVGAYLGLCPRKDQSGEQDRQLRITKAGDPYLRQLLVQCAHYILGPFGPDCDLRRKGLALAAVGGKNAKRRALIAIARRLAVKLHYLWKTGEVYRPLMDEKPTTMESPVVG
jgi:transposase